MGLIESILTSIGSRFFPQQFHEGRQISFNSYSINSPTLSEYLILTAAEIVARQRVNEFNQNLIEQLQELQPTNCQLSKL